MTAKRATWLMIAGVTVQGADGVASCRIGLFQQHEVFDQLHHQFLLFRLALGHQQRQRHQRVVVDQALHRPGQQVLVQTQIPQPVRLLPSASG